MQNIQCGGDSFFPRYFSILCWFTSLWSLSSQARLPTAQYLMGGQTLGFHSVGQGSVAPRTTSYLLQPYLFFNTIIYLPSLILVCPRDLWRPRVWPMTQYPYPGPFIPTIIIIKIKINSLLWNHKLPYLPIGIKDTWVVQRTRWKTFKSVV